MAYWALAEMEGQEVEEFWNAFYKKKPKDMIEYLTCSKTNWASKIVAKEFNRLIEPWTMEETPKVLANETIEEIDTVAWALQGKTGAEVCECYRKVMQIGGLLAEYKGFWHEYTYYESQQGNQIRGTKKGKGLSYCMAKILHITLLQCQDKQLGELAIEFYETYGELYFESAVTAKLLEDDGSVIDWIIQQLKEGKVSKEVFVKALECIEWSEKEQSYLLKLVRTHHADNKDWEVRTSIQAIFDEDRFIQFLMEQFSIKSKQGQVTYAMDSVMSKWIRAENTSFCEKLTEYYYKKALHFEDNSSYLTLLQRCHVKECKGLAVRHFKGRVTSFWEIEQYFKCLSATVENKKEEAKEVYDLLLCGDIRLRFKESDEYMQNMKERYIQDWANS